MSEDDGALALVEFMATSMVSDTEAVRVTATDGGDVIELETAAGDRGRVIGRQGRVAKAMRAVMAASRTARDARLEIVD